MGIFDPLLNPLAWFDESLIPEAWFDSDLIPVPMAITTPLFEVFLAVKPDYPHPEHDHDDLVAVATADFLVLAFLVIAILQRMRAAASRRGA